MIVRIFGCLHTLIAGVLALLASSAMATTRISILGDSYSTYSGTPGCTIPHYPGTTYIEADEQWWVPVIESVHGQLEMNLSQGGSWISGGVSAGGSFHNRAYSTGLGSPDAIFIFGGMNDDWNSGTAEGIESGTKALFAYLDTAYPNARKYFILNAQNCTYNRGLKAATRTALLNACTEYNYPVTDLDGILGTEATDMTSGAHDHPTASGLAKIGAAVIRTLEEHPIFDPPPASDLAELTGTVTTKAVGSDQVFIFTRSGTFKPKCDLLVSRALVVGGGGAGGWTIGGGGGGGGVVELDSSDLGILGAGTNCTITVGEGGLDMKSSSIWVNGGDGGPSSLVVGDNLKTFSVFGGGGGAGYHNNAKAEVTPTQEGVASGGGACTCDAGYSKSKTPGKGTPGQGHDGGAVNSWSPGGGGGFSEPGENGNARGSGCSGNGGAGYTCNITGTEEVYGSGGGGGAGQTAVEPGNGGIHAGNGAKKTDTVGFPADAGFGGGGGGGRFNDSYIASAGGAGGSGTVILRVSLAPKGPFATTTVTPDVSTADVSVRLDYLGSGGSSCSVKYALRKASEGAFGELVTVKEGAVLDETVNFTVPSLDGVTEYVLKLVLTNNCGEPTESLHFFTTVPNDPFKGAFTCTATCVTNRVGERLALTFKTDGTLTVLKKMFLARGLVVGGGGAGGWTIGGGGGGGGVIELAYSLDRQLAVGTTLTAQIGAGGNNYPSGVSSKWAAGGKGGNSVLIVGETTYTAKGGGGGGMYNSYTASTDCGSGGGAANGGSAGVGTAGQGNNGGAKNSERPGGGGGAGEAGQAGGSNYAGRGGEGVTNNITGVSEVYGSGGGGGTGNTCLTFGVGGTHAGAGASKTVAEYGHPGDDGFGGGGGGGSFQNGANPLGNGGSYGGAGGAGTVIILLEAPAAEPTAVVTVSPSVTTAAVGVAVKFTGEGTSCSVAYAVRYDLPGVEYGALTTAATGLSEGAEIDFPLESLVPAHAYRLKVVVTNDAGYESTYEQAFETLTNKKSPLEGITYTGDCEMMMAGKDAVLRFLSSGTLTLDKAFDVNRALLVAGGGAGGWTIGGGGGGGGVITVETPFQLAAGDHALTVGAGGSRNSGTQDAAGGNGGNTVATLGGTAYTAVGGGGGGYGSKTGKAGGSGGGSTLGQQTASAGTSGQGFAGGKSAVSDVPGGGGGADGAGADGTASTTGANGLPGAGGAGRVVDITGENVAYGGGGGAGAGKAYNVNYWTDYGVFGEGGAGGGGRGGYIDTSKACVEAENGTDGLGGGGGGGYCRHADQGGFQRGIGGNGGSGVIILRVPCKSFDVANLLRDCGRYKVSFVRQPANETAEVTVCYGTTYGGDRVSDWQGAKSIGAFAIGSETLEASFVLPSSARCFCFVCDGDWSVPFVLEEVPAAPGFRLIVR